MEILLLQILWTWICINVIWQCYWQVAHFLSYYISWHPEYVSWLLFTEINLQFQNSTLIVSCYYLLKFNSQQISFDWFLQII